MVLPYARATSSGVNHLRQHPYLRLIRSIVADDASGATLGARNARRKVGRLGVLPNGKRCT
jgi:hypothetical protein